MTDINMSAILRKIPKNSLIISVVIAIAPIIACKDNPVPIEPPPETQDLKTINSLTDTLTNTSTITEFSDSSASSDNELSKNTEENSEAGDRNRDKKNSKNVKNSDTLDTDAALLAIPVPAKKSTNAVNNTQSTQSPDWSGILLKAGVGAIAGTAAGSLLDSAINNTSGNTGNTNTGAIIGGLSGAAIGGLLANGSLTSITSSSNAQSSP